MKKNTIALLLIIGILFTNCKGSQINSIEPNTIQKTTTSIEVIDRDTLFIVEADNSYYEAYLACVNNKIVVKDASIKPSKNKALQPPIVNIKNNKLTVNCEVEAQKLFKQWKEQFTKEIRQIEIRIPVSVPLTTWQTTQIWLGRIFIIIGALAITRLFWNPLKTL